MLTGIREKYLYSAVYYTKAPYKRSHYLGPSFLESRRARGPRRVLDVGSGYGYWLRDAAAYWPVRMSHSAVEVRLTKV
jgi:hypothetical protein